MKNIFKTVVGDVKTMHQLKKIDRAYNKRKKEIERERVLQEIALAAERKERARVDRIENCKITVPKLVW